MGISRRRSQEAAIREVADDLTPDPPEIEGRTGPGVRRARQAVATAPTVRELDPDKDASDGAKAAQPIRKGPPQPILYDKPEPQYARGRELASLLFVAAAVFLALATASYSEKGGADWVGPVGARIAGIAISGVGLMAWAIPIELALFAIPFLRGRPSVITPARLAGDVVLGATGAALLHVGAAGRQIFGGHPAGGVVGELFGEVLRSLFSTVGTFLVGFTTVGLVLIARATFSFIELANRAAATSAAAASRAAASAKGVAEAWNQARDLERAGGGEPTIIAGSGSTLGDDPPSGDRMSTPSILPPESNNETSGVHARSELRVREDGAVPKEAHAIARALAGVETVDSPMVAGIQNESSPLALVASTPSPARLDVIEPIVMPAFEESSKKKPRKSNKNDEPTIAEPSPEAALQRADDVEEPAQMILPLDEDEEPKKPVAKKRRKVGHMIHTGFHLPSIDLLEPPPPEIKAIDRDQLLEDAKALVATLATYKVVGDVREIHPGPVVTTYELEPRIGTKVRDVERLANDLRLSLAKESVRIVAPIPGKNRIGFELPNIQRIPVNLRELVEDRRFADQKGALPVVLGRDIVGAPFYADLAAMPHLLVAGATGAGKSVGLNVMLTSLLYRRTPEDLRMIMIDPKVVELAPFDRIPHMLLPVVTDMKQALNALKWCVDEMERRYQLLAQAGVKNITTYNQWRERVIAGQIPNPMPRTVVATDHNGLPEEIVTKDPEMGEQQFPEKLPWLVVVVDEFADLMMSVGKGEVEPPIARLAQKARAAGIHVVLATQRPSVDVITGMIKANFPTRIAFRVAQRVDSRTILDAQGAEYLLGKGDMLVSLNGSNGLKRIQCPFVSEEEVQRVCDYLRSQGEPVFDESILAPRDDDPSNQEEDEALSPKDQEIYDRCVDLVREARKCSTSWLQRKMGLGYNKAARFVDRMERTGVVGPSVGAGKDREVLV